jgi:hypothetical protein
MLKARLVGAGAPRTLFVTEIFPNSKRYPRAQQPLSFRIGHHISKSALPFTNACAERPHPPHYLSFERDWWVRALPARTSSQKITPIPNAIPAHHNPTTNPTENQN